MVRDGEKKEISFKDDKVEREKAAKISIKEGSFWSIMEGFGTRYITPYALSIGATSAQVGMLSSLPGLLGNIFQLPFLYLMKKFSRKKIVFYSALIQAILWLPVILIGALYFFKFINSQIASNLLIITYSLVIVAGTISGPVWNSWMKDVIKEKSGEYFGKRNRIVNLVLVISMLFAGVILNYFGKEQAFKGFLIIFFIAFIGRAISSYLFKRQYEPNFKYDDNYYFSFIEFVKRMIFNNFGRFVILVSLVSFTTAIAGPYFVIYQLKYLNLSYIFYTLLILSNVIAIIIFMPLWGKFADKYGNVKVLKITGFLIPLIPLLYLVSVYINKFSLIYLVVGYLMLVEGLSGFSWAGFNLSAANFIFDAVTKQRMAICVAYFNLLNAFGVFIGALIGGFILSNWDFIFGIKSLFLIFIISGIARFFVVLVIGPILKEVRLVPEFKIKEHIKEKLKSVNVLKYIGFKPLE